MSLICLVLKAPQTILCISDVMYKKYKRLVYTPPDFSARFCKVNLLNKKNVSASLLDRGM